MLLLQRVFQQRVARAHAEGNDAAKGDDPAVAPAPGVAPLDGVRDNSSADPAAAEREAVHADPEARIADGSLAPVYGESAIGRRNIPLANGSVTVRGGAIPPGHTVWVAGHPVPVDAAGNFVAQEILPEGIHTVEVAVLDEAGNGELYLRDLELAKKDWFYVGMADVTLSSNTSHGPIDLLQGANAPYDLNSSADAQLAFYVNGKFGDGWRLTASAAVTAMSSTRSVVSTLVAM